MIFKYEAQYWGRHDLIDEFSSDDPAEIQEWVNELVERVVIHDTDPKDDLLPDHFYAGEIRWYRTEEGPV